MTLTCTIDHRSPRRRLFSNRRIDDRSHRRRLFGYRRIVNRSHRRIIFDRCRAGFVGPQIRNGRGVGPRAPRTPQQHDQNTTPLHPPKSANDTKAMSTLCHCPRVSGGHWKSHSLEAAQAATTAAERTYSTLSWIRMKWTCQA